MRISKFIYDGFDWDTVNIEAIHAVLSLNEVESFFHQTLTLKPGLSIAQVELHDVFYALHFKIIRYHNLRLIRVIKIRKTQKPENVFFWRKTKFQIRGSK